MGDEDIQILHRDISHHNVLLGKDDAPEGDRGVLIDLDLAFKATEEEPMPAANYHLVRPLCLSVACSFLTETLRVPTSSNHAMPCTHGWYRRNTTTWTTWSPSSTSYATFSSLSDLMDAASQMTTLVLKYWWVGPTTRLLEPPDPTKAHFTTSVAQAQPPLTLSRWCGVPYA